MTWSDPRAEAFSAFSTVLVVAITVDFAMFFATWIAAVPTPLEAEGTYAVFQGLS